MSVLNPGAAGADVVATQKAHPRTFADVLPDAEATAAAFEADMQTGKFDSDGNILVDRQARAPVEAPAADQSAPEIQAQAQVQPPVQQQGGEQFWQQQAQQFQQMLMLQNQQFQQTLQSLPQMLAQHTQQFLPQQPVPQVVDPMAQLSEDDPDYFYKRLEIQNQQMAKQLEEVNGWRKAQEAERAQAARQGQQDAEHRQFVQHVSGEVNRAADSLLSGWPADERTTTVRRLLCEQIDRVWWQNGYNQDGYVQGFKAARALLPTLAPLRTQGQPAAPTQQAINHSAPLGGARPASLPEAAKPRTPTEFWANKERQAAGVASQFLSDIH